MNYKNICVFCMLFFGSAHSANAVMCYLPEGCDKMSAYESVYTCSQLGGYYKTSNVPAGYNCVSAESECPGMVKCAPNPCITAGYTYIGVKSDEDAWEYVSCPQNSTNNSNTLFYKRKARPCETGYSIAVSADDCPDGFLTSHNSGNYVCGKCLLPAGDKDICTANNMHPATYQPSGCQVCNTVNFANSSNSCLKCVDFSESYYSKEELLHNGCVKSFGQTETLTESGNSVICYKKSSTSYKTAQEAGCHKDNYDAVSCSCYGDDDGCPNGYFKEIYGDCPTSSDFAQADSNSKCISCVYEDCSGSAENGFRTASATGLRAAAVQTMADNTQSDTEIKRTYVDIIGRICTEVCEISTSTGLKQCEENCQANIALAPNLGSSSTNRTCVKRSIFLNDVAVFSR